jgi:heme-degrading monooxygenase HmoA
MFAVIFEVNPKAEAWDAYLGHAAVLRPELQAIDGFIANERYRSLRRPGWLVSLSIWRDEKALIRWRTHALHHEIQGKGRTSVFADYHLRVGEIVTDTETETVLVQQRFDATAVSADKFVTITDLHLGVGDPPGWDAFESITRPGEGLYLHPRPGRRRRGDRAGAWPASCGARDPRLWDVRADRGAAILSFMSIFPS